MTGRTIRHAITRPTVLLLVITGTALIATGLTITGGLIVGGLGVLNALRIAANKGLDTKLQFKADARGHGVTRRIRMRERRALDGILAYAAELREKTLEPKLGAETSAEAWAIIRDAGGKDCTEALEKFRAGLPELGEQPLLPELRETKSAGLPDRIAAELERKRKIDREIESL